MYRSRRLFGIAGADCARDNDFAPTEKPINRFVIRLISEPVEPTAANDCLPANCPTTTTSAALNNNCKTLERINGIQNNINLPITGPFNISISFFFTLSISIRL